MAPATRSRGPAAKAAPGAKSDASATDREKFLQLLERLEQAGCPYRSLLSIAVPAGSELVDVSERLASKLSTAASMQLREEREALQESIKAAQQLLRKHGKAVTTGLVLFCGEAISSAGVGARVAVDIVPSRPLSTSLFMCDQRFHTVALRELLEEDGERYGFVVADGNSVLIGAVRGRRREVLHSSSEQSGGGDIRRAAVKKAADLAAKFFLAGDKPNIARLVVAGSADLKQELMKSSVFDKRLEGVLLRPLLDVACGGERGFQQAVALAAQGLQMARVLEEQRVLARLLDELVRDTHRCCYGVRNTVQALEMGAVETLVVWDQLKLQRLQLRSKKTGEDRHVCVPPAKVSSALRCPDSGDELELVDNAPFVEWITGHSWVFGVQLELVSDQSEEGGRFCEGFGGIGAVLRYRVDFEPEEDHES